MGCSATTSVIKRIVVGSDGSARAQRAVAFAAELAHQLRAEVLLVHAAGEVAPARATASDYMLHMAKSGLYPEESIECVVRTEWARPLIAAHVPWGVDVSYGWGADVLTRVADEVGAQMIVIGAGSREPSGDGGAGSVRHSLSQRSNIPLIVVPDDAPNAELHAAEPCADAT